MKIHSSIVSTIRTGFTDNDGVVRQPNERIATVLTIEYNLGIRIGDVLELRMCNLVKDGKRYCFDITEQKTGKHRGYTIPIDVYLFIQEYANAHNILPTQKLFPISERVVSKLLKITCEYLGLDGIGTHSFRKAFATNAYINSDYNIELVRNLLRLRRGRIVTITGINKIVNVMLIMFSVVVLIITESVLSSVEVLEIRILI